LEGANFEPGTETTLFIGILGGDVGSAFPGKPVAADGTVTIDMDLRASIGGCAGPSPEKDGTQYFIELTTGAPPDSIREPSASAVFTFLVTAAERCDQTWTRLDRPVAEGLVKRTWVWGPGAFTDGLGMASPNPHPATGANGTYEAAAQSSGDTVLTATPEVTPRPR
jgi:hypothetical protein